MFDLGIAGKRALVCGSSAGIGRACAEALGAAGVHVTLNGRDPDRLAQTLAELTADGISAASIAADVTTPEGRQAALAACPEPDILVNNAGGPPMGDFRDFDEAVWQAALNNCMIAPIMMTKAVIDPMIKRGWGRIINITSTSVKAPMPLLALSNGARSGLTGFIAGIAREVAASGVTINNILPGSTETDRLKALFSALAAKNGVSESDFMKGAAAATPMKRFGTPMEVGAFCAFLCSEQAAYVTGQNLVIDGGQYPGL